MVKRIGVALPSRETFTLKKSGAVALCARDFARFSRYAGRIDVIGAGACEYADVSYRRLENWRRWWRRERWAYAEAVAEIAADYALIEVQNRPYMMARLRRRAPGAKLALYLHNDPQGMAGSRSAGERWRLLSICDAIYCVSDFVRARLLEGISDPGRRACVAHPGVSAEPARREKERIVAYVGRVIAEKGVVELARAFALAAPEMPGWRLVVAGADPEGLLTPCRASLGERLECLGQVAHAEAMALLARAEIAAVPSVWEEPFGRTAIEALANGCALIASGRGGLAEIAAGAAEIVAPEDAASFAAALARLAGDAVFRAALREKGRARAAAFEIGAATARLDAVRARLLGEG